MEQDEPALVKHVEWKVDCTGTEGTATTKIGQDQPKTVRCNECYQDIDRITALELYYSYNGIHHWKAMVGPHKLTKEADLAWVESSCSCGGYFFCADKPPNIYDGEELPSINVQARLDDLEGKIEYMLTLLERLIEKLDKD